MGRRRLHFGAGLGLAALLASAGCTSDMFRREENRRTDDPLLGGLSRGTGQPVAVATANQAPTYNPTPAPGAAPLPPLTPATPTSNAALASGGFAPLPGSSDLRIGNGSPTLGAPAPGTWQPIGGATDPRLGGNTPLAPAAPAGPLTPTPPAGNATGPLTPVATNPSVAQPAGTGPLRPVSATGAPAAGGGMDALMTSVRALNPRWQRLTSIGAEHRFEMQVPVPNNATVFRTVEATAATPEAAVRAALDQLAREP